MIKVKTSKITCGGLDVGAGLPWACESVACGAKANPGSDAAGICSRKIPNRSNFSVSHHF